jgi:hypothetical protein
MTTRDRRIADQANESADELRRDALSARSSVDDNVILNLVALAENSGVETLNKDGIEMLDRKLRALRKREMTDEEAELSRRIAGVLGITNERERFVPVEEVASWMRKQEEKWFTRQEIMDALGVVSPFRVDVFSDSAPLGRSTPLLCGRGSGGRTVYRLKSWAREEGGS